MRRLLSLAAPLEALGDWSLFSLRAFLGIFSRHTTFRVLLPVFFGIGVRSVGVVIVTGAFIGMVLAVQGYVQLRPLGLETLLGAVTNTTILAELGPVLAAVMLAGRVGSSMAAELGTMRVTEQIDALACLGVDPVHYLVTPRLLACMLLIPLLTIIADTAGMLGAGLVTVYGYGVDPHFYWQQTYKFVGLWEVLTGLSKSVVFGTVLSLICCHRGFLSGSGAEGVGKAATEAFVSSFVAILFLDFLMIYFLNGLRPLISPKVMMMGA